MDWVSLTKDFAQKYQDTFCRVQMEGSDKKSLFYLEAVEQTKQAPYLHLKNNEVGTIVLKYDTDHELDFSFPLLSLVQLKNRVVLLFKKHERQWKKGMCEKTLGVLNPYVHFGASQERIDFEILEQAFKEDSSCRNLPVMLISDTLSFKLSPDLFIGQSVQENGSLLLWFRDNPIGTINQKRINIVETQFLQEVEDYLIQTNQKDKYALYS